MMRTQHKAQLQFSRTPVDRTQLISQLIPKVLTNPNWFFGQGDASLTTIMANRIWLLVTCVYFQTELSPRLSRADCHFVFFSALNFFKTDGTACRR